MKVMQLLPALELGGTERGVVDLARAMKKGGHETVVVSSGGALVAELQKTGIPHYGLPDRRGILGAPLSGERRVLGIIVHKPRP